jgi:DNA primase small subunit
LDIDMDDYNAVRTCCQGANVCKRCWAFMSIAVRVLDIALRVELGFKHLFWVFSGRRGVHCWVCDESARVLSAEARSAIIGYLSAVKPGGPESRKRAVFLSEPMHPALQRAYDDVLRDYFVRRLVVEQDLLHDDAIQERILALLDDHIARALKDHWDREPDKSSAHRWRQLEKTVLKDEPRRGATRIAEIIFTFTYPRLDIAVSRDLNHLLKSPFCVHPGTGFVSVPIDPADCELFDPVEDPPHLHDLVGELLEPSRPQHANERFQASLDFFQKRFLRPLNASLAAAANSSSSSSSSSSQAIDF